MVCKKNAHAGKIIMVSLYQIKVNAVRKSISIYVNRLVSSVGRSS